VEKLFPQREQRNRRTFPKALVAYQPIA